jgi:hypothetical protein
MICHCYLTFRGQALLPFSGRMVVPEKEVLTITCILHNLISGMCVKLPVNMDTQKVAA